MSERPRIPLVLVLGVIGMFCAGLLGVGAYVYNHQLLPRHINAQSKTPAQEMKRIDGTWSRYWLDGVPITVDLPAIPYSYYYPPRAYTGSHPKLGFYTASGVKYDQEINALFGGEKQFTETWMQQGGFTNPQEHLRVWPRGVHVYRARSSENVDAYVICAMKGKWAWMIEVWLRDPDDTTVVDRIGKSIRFEY